MNAGRILRHAGYDTPELREAIAPVDPDRINVWPASRWHMKLWQKGIKGITQGSRVFVDPALFDEPVRLARLVVHELVHVRQFETTGYLRFMTRYVVHYAGGMLSGLSRREAYLAIPAEVEARDITRRLVSG